MPDAQEQQAYGSMNAKPRATVKIRKRPTGHPPALTAIALLLSLPAWIGLSASASGEPVSPAIYISTLPSGIAALPAQATPTPWQSPWVEGPLVYGRSFDGHDLKAYRIGTGPIAKAAIGGIHGGYEWNSMALVAALLSRMRSEPGIVPAQVSLYLIPLANPDGMRAGANVLEGRFNGNGVDLNRNWDYKWRRYGTHAGVRVSAGKRPFSEPETASLRDFIISRRIQDVIFYHSSGALVFSGADASASRTVELARLLSSFTGYHYAPEGIPWDLTSGDAIDWLSSQGINAVEVELSTHHSLDWEQNWPAFVAFLYWDLDR
jgi:hypothetical protein